MIISVTKSYNSYFEDRVSLKGPAANAPTEMIFALQQQKVETGFSTTIGKKPVASFYDIVSGKPIEPRYWTAEMQQYAKSMIAKKPVPNAGVKYTMFGKLFIGFATILFISCIAYLAYAIMLKAPQDKLNKESFTAMPVVGDKYFGNLFGDEFNKGGTLKSAWIKVNSINTADSIAEIQLSNQIGATTFNTESMDHENFSGKTYTVKFRVNDKASEVIFRSTTGDIEVVCRTYSGDYRKYKISTQK